MRDQMLVSLISFSVTSLKWELFSSRITIMFASWRILTPTSCIRGQPLYFKELGGSSYSNRYWKHSFICVPLTSSLRRINNQKLKKWLSSWNKILCENERYGNGFEFLSFWLSPFPFFFITLPQFRSTTNFQWLLLVWQQAFWIATMILEQMRQKISGFHLSIHYPFGTPAGFLYHLIHRQWAQKSLRHFIYHCTEFLPTVFPFISHF